MWYQLEAPDGSKVRPIHPTENWEGRWAISRQTYEKLKAANEIKWIKRDYGWVPYSVEWAPSDPSIPNPSILTDVGQNRQAKAQLNEILGTDHGFETPKPIGLLRRLLQIATDSDSLVLDCFAGSGTTGHAVLALNKSDDGKRRFILVEMDSTICRSITAERLKRACIGYKKADGTLEQGMGGGFCVATLGDSVFDESGNIRQTVRFGDLARHVYFSETGEPLPRQARTSSSLVGVYRETAIYLLYNGILRDKAPNGGNVLTTDILAHLPKHKGPRVIYGTACRLGAERLRREDIAFKQLPYKLKVSAR